jgi:hypothetical protein
LFAFFEALSKFRLPDDSFKEGKLVLFRDASGKVDELAREAYRAARAGTVGACSVGGAGHLANGKEAPTAGRGL